jgi:hypothetical protein
MSAFTLLAFVHELCPTLSSTRRRASLVPHLVQDTRPGIQSTYRRTVKAHFLPYGKWMPHTAVCLFERSTGARPWHINVRRFAR